MTARLDVTPKTTEQNRILRSGKSEAEVTNNQKKTALDVSYTIEANYADRHEHTKHRAAFLRQQSYLSKCMYRVRKFGNRRANRHVANIIPPPVSLAW